MSGFFDNLSNEGSDSEFYSDSDDSNSTFDFDSYITEDGDEYDPLGPDLEPLDETESEWSASEPSSTTSLVSLTLQPSPPIYLPIRPGDTTTSRSRSVSPSPSLTPIPEPQKDPKKASYHTIGARITALTMFTLGYKEADYKEATGVSQSRVYKIRSKAKSRGWMPGKVVQVEHIDDKP